MAEQKNNMMLCPDCGREVSKRAANCPGCGAPLQSGTPQPIQVQFVNNNGSYNSSPDNTPAQPHKSRTIYILLAIFVGIFGIHNFYAGYIGTGIIQLLLTLSCIGVIITLFWLLFDILLTTKDGQGVPFVWSI